MAVIIKIVIMIIMTNNYENHNSKSHDNNKNNVNKGNNCNPTVKKITALITNNDNEFDEVNENISK